MHKKNWKKFNQFLVKLSCELQILTFFVFGDSEIIKSINKL